MEASGVAAGKGDSGGSYAGWLLAVLASKSLLVPPILPI